jgi:exopolysaccharide biosynthesis polyprenyl glycosylphosphotransferase
VTKSISLTDDGIGAGRGTFRYSLVFRNCLSRWRFIACLQVFDFAVFFTVAIFWLRALTHSYPYNSITVQLLIALLSASMTHCVFQSFRMYDFKVLLRAGEGTSRAILAGAMAFVPFLALLVDQSDTPSEAIDLAYDVMVVGLLCVSIVRPVVARLARALQNAGLVVRRFYIISSGAASAEQLKARLEESPENHVIGTWDIACHQDPDASMDKALEGALAFLHNTPVDAVVLKLPWSQPDRISDAARVLRSLPRQVLLAPSFDDGASPVFRTGAKPAQRGSNSRNVFRDGLADMMMITISDRPLSGWRWVMKDAQDRLIALLLLIIVLPVMLAIMIGIKLSDKGPVFFRQKRRGFGGNTFDIIKFRTMRVAASPSDGQALKLTTRGDPRIFPFGQLLRKTSLDELPQLLNVLKGEMWIVGPRPHSPLAQAGGIVYADAVRDYSARYRIKPGITGWAQVRGWRGPTNTLEQLANRVEHDLYYIENWSAFFDVKILCMTVLCTFGHENAF